MFVRLVRLSITPHGLVPGNADTVALVLSFKLSVV